MEPATPLDYAPPALPRRTRMAAGILAYLFASYAVGVVAFAGRDNDDITWIGLVAVMALLPALLPLGMLLALLRGTAGLVDLVMLAALPGLFIVAFRHL